MPKAQSLAEALGISEPASNIRADSDRPEEPKPLDLTAVSKMTAQEFADAYLNSLEFRQYIIHSTALGTIPPAVVTRLMDYGTRWGKPAEKLEIVDRSDVDEMNAEECEAEARRLAALARRLRGADDSQSVH